MIQDMTGESRVELADLVIREEDGDHIVGRVDSGEFVALPQVGARAVQLLRDGDSLEVISARLAEEYGEKVDMREFVADLAELGFVLSVNGVPVSSGQRDVATHLPWLHQSHIAWIFSLPAKICYGLLVLGGVLAVTLRPELLPSTRNLLLSDSPSVVITVNTALFLLVVAAHESAHLVAARSLGLPARISLGTRLYNLVAQTDLSALWSVPRAQRFRGYLAGIVSDVGLASTVVITQFLVPMPAWLNHSLSAMVVLIVLGLIAQLQLYMRTDLYFVLCELLGARNLFEDATIMLLGLLRMAPRNALQVSPRERRVVMLYMWLMVTGSAGAMAFFGWVVVPALVILFADAVRSIVSGITGGELIPVLDGVTTVGIEGGLWVLFVVVFVRSRREWMARIRKGLAA